MDKILCTNNSEINCEMCLNQGRIHCKRDVSILLGFFAAALPPGLIAISGLVLTGVITGHWWPLISYCLYFVIMIAIIEPVFLCRHCPFYAAKGNVLHCHANEGSLKLLKYNPGPMSIIEKTLMVVFALSIFLWPGVFFCYTLLFYLNNSIYDLAGIIGFAGLAGAFLITSISCIYICGRFLCSKCINFSCPFNMVQKKYVDEYLNKNILIKTAWKESGYKID
jgi:hypothetical protein